MNQKKVNKKALDHSLNYIRDWLSLRFEREDLPGLAVSIGLSGKVLLNEAYGYADLENKQQLSTSHIFRIASHSKTFTATAILMLAEQGKLNIDDPADKYLNWLAKHKDKRFNKITIRQLLSHGAGLIRDGLDQDYWALKRPFPDSERFKNDILEADLVIDNNTKLKYSNYGYTLLGMIIESLSGQSYNSYVTENIVKPLGLKNTGPEINQSVAANSVTGYTRADYQKQRRPIQNVPTNIMSPATGFYSNGSDLTKYWAAQAIGSGKLLSDESKKEMQRAQWQADRNRGSDNEAYGLGLDIEYINGRKIIGHGGGFPGQSSKSLIDTESGLSIIVLTNAITAPAGYIATNILKIIDYFQNNDNSKETSLTKYEGRFFSLWNITDVVALGHKLICNYPDKWDPFSSPEELERVEKDTFKIIKASDFSSEGELVHFKFSANGQVESIIYAGELLLPQQIYIQNTAAAEKISYEK